MFMGRRVEYDIRMIGVHDILHASCVAHRPDQRHQIKPRVFPLQLLLDGIGIIFINVEDDQHRRFGLGDLAAELAADGSAPACYQDGLALQCGEDLVVVDLYLGPAQQVRDLHVAQLADADSCVDELVGCRYGLHLTAGAFTLAIMGSSVNSLGTILGHFIGTPRIQRGNMLERPRLFIPVIISSGIMGALGAIFRIQGTPMSAGFGFAGLIGPMTAYEQMDRRLSSMILLTTLFVVFAIILGLAMKYIFVGESKFVKVNDLLIET